MLIALLYFSHALGPHKVPHYLPKEALLNIFVKYSGSLLKLCISIGKKGLLAV
jgi:hypothetical protein